MRPGTDLFDLINSMTLSEKRYFKLFASMQVKGDQNNYLRLFEEIEKQALESDTYDEVKIIQALANEKFIQYLPRVKNYLYKTIMKSLRNFHETNSVDFVMKDLLKEVHILFRKGLFKICQKTLNKARKLAYENDQYTALLEILNWERKLIEVHLKNNHFERKLRENMAEEAEIFMRMKHISSFRDISVDVFIMHKRIRESRGDKELKAMDKLMDNELFNPNTQLNSFTEKRYRLLLLSSHAMAHRKFRKAYEYRGELIDLFKMNPSFIQKDPFVYLFMFNNLIESCSKLRKFDEMAALIDEMRGVPYNYQLSASESMNIYLFTTTYIHELELYNKTCRYDKGYQVLPAVIAGLERHAGMMNMEKELLLCSRIIHLTFARGDYEECLKWVNRVLHQRKAGIRKDLLASARIMQMILHYELRQLDLLAETIHAYASYLEKRDWYFQIEKAFLTTLRKVTDAPEEMEEELLKKLQGTIEHLALDPNEKRAFAYFDYLSWIRSKLNQTTFAYEKKVVLN